MPAETETLAETAAQDGFVEQIAARRGTDSSDKNLRMLKPVTREAPVEFEAYLHRIADHRILTKFEEQELSRRYQAGDKRAGEQLILHNTRLVVSICRRYALLDYEFEDLIQEGILGLNRAVEKFDPSRDIKFSTYATWWVRQALQRYMQTHGNTIRIPAHIQDTKRKIERWQRDHGGSIGEACAALDITEEQALDAFEGPRVSASLDASLGEDGDEGRHALIEDKDSPDPLEVMAGTLGVDPKVLHEAMERLDPQTKRVLEMRFGFEKGGVRSRNEVSAELGMRTHAVQRAQSDGLAELRRMLEADGSIEGRDGSTTTGDTPSAEAVFSSFRRLEPEPSRDPCSRTREGEE